MAKNTHMVRTLLKPTNKSNYFAVSDKNEVTKAELREQIKKGKEEYNSKFKS